MVPVQLEYSAPEDCPTQAEFVAAVAGRGGDFSRPAEGVSTRTLIVTIRGEANGHSGMLQARTHSGITDPREVHGSRCADVADALAVIAALALLRGSEASAGPETDRPTATPAALDQSLADTPAPGGPASAPVIPNRDTRLRPAGSWASEQIPVTEGKLDVARDSAVRLSGGILLGAVPGVALPRYDLALTFANYIGTPDSTRYLIGSVLRIHWTQFGNSTHRSGTYSTEFNGFMAGVSACAPFTYDTTGFVALFCSGFAVGQMHLETADGASNYSRTQSTGFGSASLGFDASYRLSKFFHVGMMVEGSAWIGRLNASRADGSELFSSRLFNGSALLGIGLQF